MKTNSRNYFVNQKCIRFVLCMALTLASSGITKVYSQTMINDSTYLSKDSLLFRVNERITLGTGTLPNGNFKYIYINPNNFFIALHDSQTGQLAPTNLESRYSNLTVVISHMKKIGTKKMGWKTVFLVQARGVVNYQLEIEEAIQSGEVLRQASHK